MAPSPTAQPYLTPLSSPVSSPSSSKASSSSPCPSISSPPRSISSSTATSPPPSTSSDTGQKPSISYVVDPNVNDACVQCELAGLACSFEQLVSSEDRPRNDCLRCIRKGQSLCIIQSRSKHFRRGELIRIREFRAANVNTTELDAIQRYGEELLDKWEEIHGKKNWVLPRWEIDKDMKTRKVLWRMILWNSANKREGKGLTEYSTTRSSCLMPGLIDFI